MIMSSELSAKARETTTHIAEYLAAGKEYNSEPLRLSLPEFRNVYVELVRHLENRNPYAVLIFFADQVIATFPQFSKQQFTIPQMTDKFLTPDSFDFILRKQVYGLRGKLPSFGQFLISEARLYWIWLTLTFILSFIGLHLAGGKDLYETLSSLLIQSATVFVSIFLIFTVTQNTILQKDIGLFKQGLLHRYRRDDRNVAILGVLVVGLVILNSIFLALPQSLARNLSMNIYGYELNLYNFWGALTTSAIIVLLLDAFIGVVSYYLERSQDLVDRDFIREVFANERAYFAKSEAKEEVKRNETS